MRTDNSAQPASKRACTCACVELKG